MVATRGKNQAEEMGDGHADSTIAMLA